MAGFRGDGYGESGDVKFMDMENANNGPEQPVSPDEPVLSSSESDYILNIVGVFQDHVTREWAEQSFHRATQLAGEERIQNSWYHANSLSDPAILVEAVQATLAADVIVVAVYAADELPVDLYVWFDAWLPRRLSRAGALAAVVGVDAPLQPQSLRTFDYLEAVARKAQLDFIPDERLRPDASLPAAAEPVAGRIRLRTRSIPEVPGQFDDGYNHCGLHE
jgi:hypothetical protein